MLIALANISAFIVNLPFLGMADNNCDRLISFRDYITNVNNMYIYEGAFSRIDPLHKYSSSGLHPVTHPCMYSSATCFN